MGLAKALGVAVELKTGQSIRKTMVSYSSNCYESKKLSSYYCFYKYFSNNMHLSDPTG